MPLPGQNPTRDNERPIPFGPTTIASKLYEALHSSLRPYQPNTVQAGEGARAVEMLRSGKFPPMGGPFERRPGPAYPDDLPAGPLVPVNQNGFPLGGEPAAQAPQGGLSERLVNYLQSILPRPEQVEGAIMPRAEELGRAGADMRQRFGRAISGSAAGAFDANAAGRGP